MQLDPKKCPPGTVGFLPTSNVYDFEGYGDESPFDVFKKPDVVLNDDHQWVVVDEAGERTNHLLGPVEAKVFSTWQSAVQYVIDEDRRDCEAIIREAQADLAQCDKIQRWLNEGT